ncbi:MAG: M28 family metallopeptidase [Bacteroidota bacterium]
MYSYVMLSLLFMVIVGHAQQAEISADQRKAMDAITPSSLLSHIRFLSDDLLEGRGPGTRGDRLTQMYIASQMELLGLKPGGNNGTYFQPVVIKGMKTDPSAKLVMSSSGGSSSFTFGNEYVAFTGAQEATTTVENAEMVFVGYGIVAPEQQWNDYKNVDVKGKILLMLNNDPAGDDPKFFGGKARTYYGRWTYKYEIAASKGAIGAIIIHTDESAGYGWNVVQNSWSGDRFELAAKPGIPRVPLKGWTTFEAAGRILALAGKKYDALNAAAQSRDFAPVPLGVKASVTLSTSMKQVETANVIGVLPGFDPILKDEAVIYTAHHDHFGIGRTVNGDSIYNGAMDNGTGVSALLNAACAFTSLQSPPRRSIVFMTVAAEEQGLIGSQYYSENPTFSPAKIAANINIDGLPIFGRTRDIIMIGKGKSSMDDVLMAASKLQGREVKPDQFPEKGSFYRSDQFNFAKIGVPCMFLKSGLDYIGKPADFGKKMDAEYTKLHYHQPSDELSPNWDLSGAVEDVQLNYLVGLMVANADKKPVWNKGDEFERIRQKE